MINLPFEKQSLNQVTAVWTKLPDMPWHPAVILDERLINRLSLGVYLFALKISEPPTQEFLYLPDCMTRNLFLVYIYGLEEW
jgi:hypothetical protein